jgi:hypothetical protein
MEEIPTISYFLSEVFASFPIWKIRRTGSRAEREYNREEELGFDHRLQNGLPYFLF